jgi:hypothetical protein
VSSAPPASPLFASVKEAAIDPGAVRRLEASLAKVVKWVRDHRYRAYEPADGNSSLLYPLTRGQVFPMRILQQVVLRAPFNIRPFIGIRPHESSIGRGYMAWGYLHMYSRTGAAEYRDEARACLDWLMKNRAPKYDEFCWGDPYEYATRSGRRPLGEPILIWCALIGQAFLHAAEVLQDTQYRAVAESIGRWMRRLPKESTESGDCLSYVTYRQNSVHNANAMGAAFLARLAAVTGDSGHRDAARMAMLYTCARQLEDGAWYYGEEEKYRWVDNFHTGYNLSALMTYRTALCDNSFDEHLSRGLHYFTETFFEADGRSKYFNNRTYPVDIQASAQAIETLAEYSDLEPVTLAYAVKVAEWTIANLQAPDGHFRYRDLGWTKVNTPMLHWGQGTMVKALSVTLKKLDRHV